VEVRDDLDGVKAIARPQAQLKSHRPFRTRADVWERSAPDTIIVAPGRDLCEQIVEVARKLASLLPPHVQKEWKVALAVGNPPGVEKKKDSTQNAQWPFPKDEHSPDVIVTTMDFMSCFTRRRHLPMWTNIRYMVYDEVDQTLIATLQKRIFKMRAVAKTSQRNYNHVIQTALVTSVLSSTNSIRSVRAQIRGWMPHALLQSKRPDLMHRTHPLVKAEWKYFDHPSTNESYDEKFAQLLDYLENVVGWTQFTEETREETTDKFDRVRYETWEEDKLRIREKVVVFCERFSTATRLAEDLATGQGIEKVGILVRMEDEILRERVRQFRDGGIQLLVTTKLMNGLDIPDLKHAVQFDMAVNAREHLLRLGRLARAGSRGRCLMFYQNDARKELAEAIQELGSSPLDSIFNDGGAFKTMLKKTEAFRRMLLVQGLPLPPHLQAPDRLQLSEGVSSTAKQLPETSAIPSLEESLRELDSMADEPDFSGDEQDAEDMQGELERALSEPSLLDDDDAMNDLVNRFTDKEETLDGDD